MAEFQVHHVKFFNYVPSGIQSLTFNEADKLLAVGRDDNSVEIWKMVAGRKWLQQKVIPGSEKRKVNCLVWVKGRLFSAGLQGDITEYDLDHLKPKNSTYYGNAFWCLSVNHAQTHLAAGCEDGYIRLYEVTDEGVVYDRSLQMQQGRVVSLAWHVSDEVIVTGSLDNIRIWNVNTGHATLRITTQRLQKHSEVVVWQVTVLDDMTIISGDSVGRTQFWNGRHGTLLKSYTSHRASVLSLCVSRDQTSVFSAGVDPIISQFQLVQKSSGSETKHWVRGRVIREHSHDVTALVVAGDHLLSGSVDSTMAVNLIQKEIVGIKPSRTTARLRIHAFPHKPIVTLAPKARMVLLQYSHSLEVWKLGNTEASSDEDGKVLPLTEQPVKVLDLKAKGTEQISCSTISSCGSWIAYSDVGKIRFYHITYNPYTITRVPTIPSNLHPAHHLVFTPDSSKLISAPISGPTGGLQVLTVDGPDGVDCPQPLIQSLPVTEVQGPYTSLVVSDDGEWVAIAGSQGKVAVLSLSSNKVKSVVLPHTKVHPCCIAFHPSNKQIAVAYANRNIAEYDFTKHEYTLWSRLCHKEGLHRAWLDKNNMIHQLTFDPSNPDRILVQDGMWLTVIDKSKPLPRANDRLIPPRANKRKHDGSEQSEGKKHGFSICRKYKLRCAKTIEAFDQDVSADTIGRFSWKKAREDASEVLPTMCLCLEAMLPSVKAIKAHNFKGSGERMRNLTDDEALAVSCRHIGQILSQILFFRNRRKHKFVQASVGVEMWRQRVSQKVFTTLNHMGVSQGRLSAKSHVDKIGKSHDKELLTWKKKMEEKKKTEPRRKLDFKGEDQPSSERPSYGFCADNIQISKEGKLQRRDHGNTFLLQTMMFAIKDRITSGNTVAQVPACNLDPYSFLPTPEVVQRQKERAVFVVRSILLAHFPEFSHLQKKVPQRIWHENTKALQKKSECVTLGVLDADPGTTQGMIQVMDAIQKYVPVSEGEPVTCLLSGDGLTVERALNAQRSRSNGAKWDDRLEGLQACPQEFHKEMLLLQDSNKKFFTGSSLADRGTVSQLKNNFNHRSFQNDVMKSFQHVWDLYQFSTESHIILCAMSLCGMKKLEDVPHSFPTDKRHPDQQIRWVTQLARRIVEFCWTSPDKEDLHVAAKSYNENWQDLPEAALRYCICQSESTDDMVMCCNKTCKHSWFHLNCMGLSQAPDPDADWYCSEECRDSIYYTYCICHRKHISSEEQEMVQCHLGDGCHRYEWYHRSCLGLKQDEKLPEIWYCGDACALGSQDEDHVQNYTKALMHNGIGLLLRREAVREGNGPAMIDDWKIDMLHFYGNSHPKYFINGHYLLACVGGFASPQLQISYIWNRVTNATGKPGGNIGNDQTNEHLNQDYKEMTLTSRGQFTPDQLRRCAEMSGPFGKSLDDMLTSAGLVDMGDPYSKRRHSVYKDDIQRFIEEYQDDGLFAYVPGREHSAFPGFQHHTNLKDPKKLGQKLRKLSNNLDNWKKMSSSEN